MKKKKPSNGLNLWQVRQQAISSADGLVARGSALVAAGGSDPKRLEKSLKQAAMFFEAAARAYRRADLGLLARKPWDLAKDCYAQLGDQSGVVKCDLQRASIPVYWDDDPSGSESS